MQENENTYKDLATVEALIVTLLTKILFGVFLLFDGNLTILIFF